jgi:hypothetical protein
MIIYYTISEQREIVLSVVLAVVHETRALTLDDT